MTSRPKAYVLKQNNAKVFIKNLCHICGVWIPDYSFV